MTREAAPPPRPDPWATTAPREALRDNNAGQIKSLTPAECSDQVGTCSVPGFSNLVDFCGHDEDYSPDVRFTGQRAMTLRSKTQHVHGGGHGGKCEPIGHAPQVRVNGTYLPRHGDRFWMDDRCTVGEAHFVRDTACYPAPQDTDPIPGSARTVLAPSGNGGPTRSDASPDISAWQPGARTALLDETGRFTNPATPPGPATPGPAAPQAPSPAAPPQAAPSPPAAPPSGTRPPAPRSSTPRMQGGFGRWSDGLHGSPAIDDAIEWANRAAAIRHTRGVIENTETESPEEDALKQRYLAEMDDERNGIFSAIPGSDWEAIEHLYRFRGELEEMRQNVPPAVRAARQQAKRNTITAYNNTIGSGNARISANRNIVGDKNNRCILVPYGTLNCPSETENGVTYERQGHHVVADRAFRNGSRQNSGWDGTNYNYGMSQNAGLAVCLQGGASTPGTEHNEATTEYDNVIRTKPKNSAGMVRLGDAEQAGAESVERATRGGCKAADILPQLRTYHQARGMDPDTLVRP